MDVGKIIGRDRTIIASDIARNRTRVDEAIKGSRILLFGGAGSIGKEVALQIFRRDPAALHVIDISENNLVELVRDLRSSQGYTSGETLFLPIDMGAVETTSFLASQKPYDYVLNLAAMKHVRSEKDAFSLMRMININVLNTLSTLSHACATGAKKYFAVSTDKAKNPANLMGATKRIMEDVLFRQEGATQVSTARFANVAFSDGSLLHGFRQRLLKNQPLAAPRDVRRYFVTGEESGLLCLASLILGGGREIFFPKLDAESEMLTFSEIAIRFLQAYDYEPVEVASEEEARSKAAELIAARKWPCYFFNSDTAGEKPFEEFYASDDDVDWNRFSDLGVIHAKSLNASERERVEKFLREIEVLRANKIWTREGLVALIKDACPELSHADAKRFLDDKM